MNLSSYKVLFIMLTILCITVDQHGVLATQLEQQSTYILYMHESTLSAVKSSALLLCNKNITLLYGVFITLYACKSARNFIVLYLSFFFFSLHWAEKQQAFAEEKKKDLCAAWARSFLSMLAYVQALERGSKVMRPISTRPIFIWMHKQLFIQKAFSANILW